MKFLFHTMHSASKRSQGFTLVEVLVVITIVGVLLLVVFFSNQNYNNTVSVTNAAYDIALAIREAQVYGVSVKRFVGSSVDSFQNGYGVFFTQGVGASATLYTLFADVNQNHLYDAGTEKIADVLLPTRAVIYNICTDNLITAQKYCTRTGTQGGVAVSFNRPNPDALITRDNAPGTLMGDAFVCIAQSGGTPSAGAMKKITVNQVGQISVTNVPSGSAQCD